ncbi:hypothetical protein H6P81_017283 [Aristolochia fimbriata]|uniref:Uncharacterized protein n=1 Tax=Aristolochia fimbriata TaxID=158543 RepID=A0AAV7DZI1_ARIFI|nr:hypothetical protein H6P81_017283 [Aristolochia fimbriata]
MQSGIEEEGTPKGWRMKNQSESIALHEAIKRGHEEIGLQLLDIDEETAMIGNGAGESPLYLAAKSGLRMLVLRILKCPRFSSEGPNGRSPLHSAVINRNLGICEMLIQSLPHLPKQTDKFGKTAIHYAAAEAAMKMPPTRKKTAEKTIHLLLSADPSSATIPDEHGVSPPLLAAAKGNIRLLKTLLSYSPDCYYLLNSEGQNAIHLAVLHSRSKMLKFLIKRPEFEGLANEVDDGGNTYLHFAAAKCNPGIVRLLLECQGVDLNITNKDGHTCLDALPSRKGLRLRIVKSMIESRVRANLKGRPFRGR